MEITRNYDLFFNTEITSELIPNDPQRREFRQHGLKVYNQFWNLNFGLMGSLRTDAKDKESFLLSFKPPKTEPKSVTIDFEIQPSFYTVTFDNNLSRTRQLAYVDYFTTASKIVNQVQGNNIRFELTDGTKLSIGYQDDSKAD